MFRYLTSRRVPRRRGNLLLFLPIVAVCASLACANPATNESRVDAPNASHDAHAVSSGGLLITDNAGTPTVANHGGTTYVAWSAKGASTGQNVYLSIRDGGEPATVRVNVLDGDGNDHRQAPPKVAVGPKGDVYVLWTNSFHRENNPRPGSNLRFARSTDGGATFSPAVYVNHDADGPPTSHIFHDMVVANDGTIYVSWIDGRARDPLGPDIRFSRSTDGGLTFSESIVVDPGACPCCRTDLAIGPDGTIYLAWRKRFEGEVRDMVVARSTDGGLTFSAPQLIHADGWVFPGCPHAGPALEFDAEGTMHVAWYTGAEGKQGLYYATTVDGVTFTEPITIMHADLVAPALVELMPLPSGQVLVAWEEWHEERQVHVGRVLADGIEKLGDWRPGTEPVFVDTSEGPGLVWRDGEVLLVAPLPDGSSTP